MGLCKSLNRPQRALNGLSTGRVWPQRALNGHVVFSTGTRLVVEMSCRGGGGGILEERAEGGGGGRSDSVKNMPPPLWSPLGMLIGYSGEEFWEARGVENQLLTVVESRGFTLSPKGVLATFTFPVFSVSSPRGSSLGFMRTPPP